MTDYAHDLLRDEEPEPEPLLRQPDGRRPEPARAVGRADGPRRWDERWLAALQERDRPTATKTASVGDVSGQRPRRLDEERGPARLAPSRAPAQRPGGGTQGTDPATLAGDALTTTAGEAFGVRATGARTDADPDPDRLATPTADERARMNARAERARSDADRRSSLLVDTVVALAHRPAAADLDALLIAYVDAPASEVEHAAGTVTAVFLRAPAGLRRPLRAVLAPTVQRHRGTPLADRLVVRLAGGAVPPGPTPAAPGGPGGGG